LDYTKIYKQLIEKAKILKRTKNGLTEIHEHIGIFKIELLENVKKELLKECNYISIFKNNRIIQIIEGEVK
jgi:hypothetical protein